jgi:hypothetical protein
MSKEFKIFVKDDKVYYVFDLGMDTEISMTLGSFISSPLELGQYMVCNSEVRCHSEFLEFIGILTKTTARTWLDDAGIVHVKDKVLYVVELGPQWANAIYRHGDHYVLYRLKK